MSLNFTCPDCGEEEDLQGAPTQSGIEIHCLSCDAAWIRDATPRCATCGSDDIMYRPRTLRQFSRGTQLSVTGWTSVPCCLHCDADAVHRSTFSGGPLPGDYQPSALRAREKAPPTDHVESPTEHQ